MNEDRYYEQLPATLDGKRARAGDARYPWPQGRVRIYPEPYLEAIRRVRARSGGAVVRLPTSYEIEAWRADQRRRRAVDVIGGLLVLLAIAAIAGYFALR